MGISLHDLGASHHCFSVNYWNWRPIVEVVRRLKILSDERAEALHEPMCGNGLTKLEANAVADAIEAQVLSKIDNTKRLLLDGSVTNTPDDLVLHRVDTFDNYSTTPSCLREFVAFCRACSGFEVL